MTNRLIIKNILSNEERKKVIKDVQPYFLDWQEVIGYDLPGRQTASNLHKKPEFVFPIKKIVERVEKEMGLYLKVSKSWVKWSNGRENQMNWHNHIEENTTYTSVYYLKTLPFFSSGTLFEDGFVRLPQNSMIIFPPDLPHTTPKHPFPFIDRYVMVINLSKY
tara:strand:- start:293 stop:781 length:489 start_codon:yes stop_codon:yes gene_type:complete